MRSHRTRSLTLMLVLATAGCGSAGGADATRDSNAARRPKISAPAIALIQTATGISAVNAGTDHVVWAATGATAAAPDGSAVFVTDTDGVLTRLDSHTGARLESWPVPHGVAPVVVAPDGTAVALTDRPAAYDSEIEPRPATHVVVVNGTSGAISHDLDLIGDVEPEAFSVDHQNLFALDHRGDHYRVQTILLTTGERSDLIDRDKQPADDMRGRAVHGVMSTDRRQLATLYVNPENLDEPAFVHVLDLSGSSYCVHLPDKFANGPARSQSIERTADDRIVVRNPTIDRRTSFSLSDIAAGQNVMPATKSPAGTAPDAPYRAIDGFRVLVAVLPSG